MNILNELDDGVGVEDELMAEGVSDVAAFFHGENKLNLLHLNIRSLKKHFDEFILYLHEIKTENIDLMILSETWNVDEIKDFSIKGFKTFSDSRQNKNDGVVLYIRDTIVSNVEYIKLSETIILRVTFKIKQHWFGVNGIYRPPSTNIVNFLNDYDQFLRYINQKNFNEILVGDMNIDISNDLDNNVNQYKNILALYGYISCINRPTRVTQTSQTIIDHIFVRNNILKNKSMFLRPLVFEDSLTDHYAIGLSIELQRYIKENPRESEIYKKVNFHNLMQLLSTENWDSVFCESSDVEKCYSQFIYLIKDFINRSTSVCKKSNKHRKIKPWITVGIINSIRNRDKMKKDLRRDSSAEKQDAYKKYRNLVTRIIRETKNQYFKKKIKKADKNIKLIWSTINEATNNITKNKAPIAKIRNYDGEYIENKHELSNIFNVFFC